MQKAVKIDLFVNNKTLSKNKCFFLKTGHLKLIFIKVTILWRLVYLGTSNKILFVRCSSFWNFFYKSEWRVFFWQNFRQPYLILETKIFEFRPGNQKSGSLNSFVWPELELLSRMLLDNGLLNVAHNLSG